MEITEPEREFILPGLRRKDLQPNPLDQFELWFKQAWDAKIPDAHAMSLATASAHGVPTVRTVLLKKFDQKGFVFYTNFESVKARQIDENPNVELLLFWQPSHRQVRIAGKAEKVPTTESLKYFLKRPFDSRLGAWASPQSSVISTRGLLEMKYQEMKRKFSQGEVPLPSFWGGYRVIPRTIEFWQGRKNRLHDRFLYTLIEEKNWKIERLAP